MVEKNVWLDLVIDLRSAMALGTIGIAPAIALDDPARKRIHQEVKNQVVHDFAGWISKEETCTKSQ